MGTKLGNETKGYTRLPFIADTLVAAGYAVDLITSRFQHWEKAHRDTSDPVYQQQAYRVLFVDEPGYRKNIDLKRLRSHAQAARNLTKLLEERLTAGEAYDLIYIEIPPNDVALAAARFAHAHRIPIVGDINDLWPEAMRMVVDIPLVSDIAFHGLARDARETYKLLDGVVGTSDEYAARPLSDAPANTPHITVYVGIGLEAFDAEVAAHRASINKAADEFWVSYAGTLGTSYDIATMLRAAQLLFERGQAGDEQASRVRIKILGGGPTEDELKALCASLPGAAQTVEFLGYQPHDKMAAYLATSDVLVNSFVKKAPQSIVTKIGDYLAAGKPMINTCSSLEFRAKVEADGFGVNIEAENPIVLADAIEQLAADPVQCQKMSERARQIAHEQFDRPEAYKRIVSLVESLIASRAADKISSGDIATSGAIDDSKGQEPR